MRRGYHTHAYRGILSALLIACADSAVAPVTERAESADAAAAANDIARGIALALTSPELRATIRDAMRASPMNEHKLVLQDFVNTSEGRQLVAAAARALDVSEERFVQIVSGLPELDFYAPFDEHRLEWRATADVLVAATFDPENRYLDAYSIDGATVRLDYEDGTPSIALLILHPGERKVRRVVQRSATGETIEEPHERVGPGLDGTQLQSVGFNQDSTYIDFWNFHPGDGFSGDAELRFTATFLHGATQQLYFGVYEQGNVEEDLGYDVTAPLINYHPRVSSDKLRIHLWEDDPAGQYDDQPLGDDYYGYVDYYAPERGVMKQFTEGSDLVEIIVDWFDGTNRIPSQIYVAPSQPTVAAGATVQLSYTAYDQTGAAMSPSQHAAPTWQSANPAVATVSSSGRITGGSPGSTTITITVCPTLSPGSPCKQASVPVTVVNGPASLSVSINGPGAAMPNETCSWWSSVSGGTGSYTYNWYVDGAWQGGSYDLYYANTGSSFTIQLDVRDSNGATGSASHFVTVSSSEGPCTT